ncbi:heart- and neural crest derivatives-expressed protein 2 [Austrofundulus limnaeus]|uniref:Heart- and neural crest derivatives-expressed protein 2 n=1 Tax=Austrofundulus limnaeus TaxID=52670 RepID=A0A2I4D8K2_AUSLI|nr:PREDICTED: heart- and neural crest derivatives-expressed protein 2 [Austrofundulus limnaeus]
MSVVSRFPHPSIMHPHESHRYSFHAAAGTGRCHEDPGAPPYFSWLIGHADVSPSEYEHAPAFSPEYHPFGGGGSDQVHHHHCGPGGLIPGPGTLSVNVHQQHAHPRTLKRRPTANRKERRRTQSINSAFAELRECIPNVPADTKLSKIKTLRLATSYISYLMDVLDRDGQHGDTQAFRADLKRPEAREERRKRDTVEISNTPSSLLSSSSSSSSAGDKKGKGRTGWPQHVWALELKQ